MNGADREIEPAQLPDTAELLWRERPHERRRQQNLHLLARKELRDARWPTPTVVSIGSFAGFRAVVVAIVRPDMHHLRAVFADFCVKEATERRVFQADLDVVAKTTLQLADSARAASKRVRAQLVDHAAA